MNTDENYEKNDLAFRRLKAEIDAKFPQGQFVAIEHGTIIADASTHEALTRSLAAQGKDRTDIFVARAGEDYPEYADILIH